MKLKISINSKIFINLIIVLLLLCGTNYVYAKDNIEKDYKKEFEDSNYTDEYLDYLKLSDEEKSKLDVIPRKYKVSFEEYYNEKRNVQVFDAQNERLENIPSYFNLKDSIDIKIENQGDYGLCWDFATTTALETYLALRGEDYDFSEMHADYLTSNQFYEYYGETIEPYYSRDLHSGGNFDLYNTRYIGMVKGPVYETLVPYKEVETNQYDYLKNLHSLIEDYNCIYFPYISPYDKKNNIYSGETLQSFRNEVKKHIMNNGGVYAYFDSDKIKTNPSNGKSVCYSDSYEIVSPHAVCIVGWDDNFSKDNFPNEIKPKNNGAYIAVNSWGDWWGDNGYFYISYDDIYVETDLAGFTYAKLADENNPNYQIKEIKCTDANVYNELKKSLYSYIIESDDSTNTIKIYKISLNVINELHIANISDFSFLNEFTNLKYLSLENCTIDNLEVFKNIKSISFYDCMINDYEFSKIPNLESISIFGAKDTINIEKINKIFNTLNKNVKKYAYQQILLIINLK